MTPGLGADESRVRGDGSATKFQAYSTVKFEFQSQPRKYLTRAIAGVTVKKAVEELPSLKAPSAAIQSGAVLRCRHR